MSYETCNALYPTRAAAIAGLVSAWVDVPTLARCTDAPVDLVAEMRADGWFADFEARYGDVGDLDIAEAVTDLRTEARMDNPELWSIRAECDDEAPYTDTAAEWLEANEGDGDVEAAIKALACGAQAVTLGGGAAPAVRLTVEVAR